VTSDPKVPNIFITDFVGFETGGTTFKTFADVSKKRHNKTSRFNVLFVAVD